MAGLGLVGAHAPIRPKRSSSAGNIGFIILHASHGLPLTLFFKKVAAIINQVNFGMNKTKISWQIATAAMIRFTLSPPRPTRGRQSNRFYPLNQLTALYAIV
jgi:hypothetical protein